VSYKTVERFKYSTATLGKHLIETYQQKTNFENFSSFVNKTLNKIVLNKTAAGAE